MEPFIGTVQCYGFNFAPRSWAFCNGQLLSIAQNTALFSLLGTTYGGDGRVTFALPNLQSRVPIHFGQGQGLSSYALGQVGGTETVTLNTNQMPVHTHPAFASNEDATVGSPKTALLAISAQAIYGPPNSPTLFNPAMIGPAGGSQPHENIQPYLALNFCIALEGIFPSRN